MAPSSATAPPITQMKQTEFVAWEMKEMEKFLGAAEFSSSQGRREGGRKV